jgi:virginiamycin B lyase
LNRPTKAALFVALSLAVPASFADTVDIREWLVPWQASGPTDPYVDSRGRVWFVGAEGDYVGNFTQQSAGFNRYDLQRGSAPAALLVDRDDNLWYASNKRRHIGRLSPSTGRVTIIDMPDRKARELRSLAFDGNGDIWFTAEDGNLVGRLRTASEEIDLIALPTRNSRPYGIAVSSLNQPWVAASGTNLLISIDPATLAVSEFTIPDEDARPRRIVATSDNQIWYADYARGVLGRLEPGAGSFTEWSMPGGTDSRPFGMAVDRNDRIWIVETGLVPNRLVAFDPAIGVFLTESDIPSGAGSISHLHYHEAAGEIWFGTATNYVGRAIVH